MRRSFFSVLIVLATAGTKPLWTPASAGIARGASFEVLGVLPGRRTTVARGISADGEVVVGTSSSGYPAFEGFRWTALEGMTGLGDLPGGDTESRATAASADGSVIAGWGESAEGYEACLWTADAVVGLGDLPGGLFRSRALGVSDDGTVVVGYGHDVGGRKGFRWTVGGGMVDLGVIPEGAEDYEAHGVSADGSVVVGEVWIDEGYQAFRWTRETGVVLLGVLPDYERSYARAASADGSVVIGWSDRFDQDMDEEPGEAFRWTEADGLVSLGVLPEGISEVNAFAVSADGSVVVGTATSYDAAGHVEERGAFLWEPSNGLRFLEDVLTDDFGLDLGGWSLLEAAGISADGTVIAGWGKSPNGVDQQAWRAVIPEPSTMALLSTGAVGLVIVTWRRRLSRRPARGLRGKS